MMHMNKNTDRYEQQRLTHCEDCGALYAQYVEHDYPQCDDCLTIELEDTARTTREWEEARRQSVIDGLDEIFRRHHERD